MSGLVETMRAAQASWCALAALIGCGCDTTTGVQLRIDSSMMRPAQLASVRAEARTYSIDAATGRLGEPLGPPARWDVEDTEAQEWPVRIGISPLVMPSAVEIIVTANPGHPELGCTFSVRRAVAFELRFIEDIVVQLDAACCGVACEAGQSCTYGCCVWDDQGRDAADRALDAPPDNPCIVQPSSCVFGDPCNGFDDDCDGVVDQPTYPHGQGVCAVPQECVAGVLQPPPPALPPDYSLCGTGVDADCDGDTDEGPRVEAFPDDDRDGYGARGSAGTPQCAELGGGVGSGRSLTDDDCNDGDASISPEGAEACNGVDDDCDGEVDTPVHECAQGSTGGCMTTCGSTGTRACSQTCAWGTCVPPPERCNGRDDDCDDGIDEGFACPAGSARGCTDECGTGTMVCDSTSCTWPDRCSCGAPFDCNFAGTCNFMTGCSGSYHCCTNVGSATSCPSGQTLRSYSNTSRTPGIFYNLCCTS